MKKYIGTVITVLVVIAGIVVGFLKGVTLSENQVGTLLILAIIAGCSALYCFVVGEITGNTSQMDKLWSILPIAYMWIIAARGGMSVRLIVIAVLVTLWGARLTYNFSLKGAYKLKFWQGREDYRWMVLRQNKILKHGFVWALFNLFFISIYQNALVLAICLPALAGMDSVKPFGLIDVIAAVFVLGFLILETVSDRIQWNFHSVKHKLLSEGKELSEIPAPYNKGFNTVGIWSRSRHPNYLGEQGFWISLYFFAVGAGAAHYGIFNWSIFGCLLLIFLFLGSSAFGESVSASKYPEYAQYQKQVSKYIPLRKYKSV